MCYQNYDDYMRDVFYFNQMPNQNMGFQNYGYNQMNLGNQPQNYNNLYPSIYRTIKPVVSRVVTGNNCQYLTEDSLNSMVDTIYNIIEGDISLSNDNENSITGNQNSRTQNQSSTQTNTTSRSNDNNQNATALLKDLIKIMILNEMSSRNNFRRMQNQMMYQNQFYPNYYDQRCMY